MERRIPIIFTATNNVIFTQRSYELFLSTAAVVRPLLHKKSPSTRDISLSGNNIKI